MAVLAGGRVIREGSVEALCREGSGWRARLVTGATDALVKLGLVLQPDGWWRVPAENPQELNRTLAALHQADALLVELRPFQDLESVLVEAVREVA